MAARFTLQNVLAVVIPVVAILYLSAGPQMMKPPPPGPGGLYPGDEVIPDAVMIYDQTKLVKAPPVEVWPWVQQVGKGRGGTLHERLQILQQN